MGPEKRFGPPLGPSSYTFLHGFACFYVFLLGVRHTAQQNCVLIVGTDEEFEDGEPLVARRAHMNAYTISINLALCYYTIII